MARVLALDPGMRRVGVAVSDELGLLARALTTLPAEPAQELLSAIAKLCSEQAAGEVVIGLPRHMNGDLGDGAQRSLQLQTELAQRLEIPVVTWDERLTTREAERTLVEADLSRKRRRKVIDEQAAAVLLQAYLDAKAAKRRNAGVDWNPERMR